MDRTWNDFLNTMSFMSRIPVKVNYPAEMKLVFYPLAGLVIASMVYFSSFITSAIFEPEISALLLLIFYVYLTGALHLDGVGDFFDGYFADRDREKTIKIMHDSNSGVYAVVSLILILILKYLLFKELLLKSRLDFLLAMAVMARFYAAAALGLFEAAEASIWAKSMEENSKKKDVSYAVLMVIILLTFIILIFGIEVMKIILAAAVLNAMLIFYLNSWAEKKIGGITGDICGTIIELSEIIFLMTAAIF